MVRIIIVDDHFYVREAWSWVLNQVPRINVIAQCANGQEAIEAARRLQPDVMLMDINMEPVNGIEATRQILRDAAGVKVIALSMHSDRHFIERMLQSGASGYLLKHCASRELITAIRTVQAGKFYLSRTITDLTLEEALALKDASSASPSSSLTAKEREVLQMVAEGYSTKLIAGRLHVTENTIEKHRQHIMDKLGLHSIADLTKYAIREGMTSLEK